METQPTPAWYRRRAWVLVLVLGALLMLFGLFVLFSPVDSGDFEAETGLDWSRFSAAEPDVASYLEREARLLAAITLGFGLFAAGIAYGLMRRGNRTGWVLEWILPATLGLAAVVFFASDAATLGSFYLFASVLAAAGLGFAHRTTR